MNNSGMGNAHGSDNLAKAVPPNGSSAPPGAAEDNSAAGTPTVSRSPLNLGGSAGPAAPSPAAPHPPASPAASRPATPSPGASRPGMPGPGASRPGMASPAAAGTPAKAPVPQVPIRKPVVAASPAPVGRITNCKTFFTKLHPGAIEFMDDQISHWLKDNPNVVVKLTNTIMGEVQAKKTEPNILITIWY